MDTSVQGLSAACKQPPTLSWCLRLRFRNHPLEKPSARKAIHWQNHPPEKSTPKIRNRCRHPGLVAPRAGVLPAPGGNKAARGVLVAESIWGIPCSKYIPQKMYRFSKGKKEEAGPWGHCDMGSGNAQPWCSPEQDFPRMHRSRKAKVRRCN